MSIPEQTQDAQSAASKEVNFVQLRELLKQEKEQREKLERELQEERAKKQQARVEADDDYDDLYIDKSHLEKKLNKFSEQTKQYTQSEIQKAVAQALQEEKRQNWLKANPDFYQTMNFAEKFAEKDPELAETILQMPEGFERQKLVYRAIKTMGLDKPEPKEPSIQDKINANRRSPYYQPSGVSGPGYASNGDFSEVGQKSAYEKLQQLKKNLRL